MKIETVTVESGAVRQQQPNPKMVMVRITGPVDTNNRILQRAREMVERLGSTQAMESFNVAVANDLFRSDR